MKKKVLELSTKWVYTWPAWLHFSVLVLAVLDKNLYLTPLAAPLSAITVTASWLLATDKWQGSIVGCLNGIYLIIEYYYKLHINKKVLIDSRPLGLLIIVYYIYMGYRMNREDK